MGNKKGFTLIELVVVIVILGILAAVAVPKFVDMKSEAAFAAADGLKGSIDSASAINYAAYLVNPTKGVAIGATGTATNCEDAVTAILQDVDSKITGLPTAAFTKAAGEVEDCSFTYENEPRTAKIILTVN